nr:TrmH family RNA methyltransferase [Acuticoccus kalidii]
MPETGPVRLPVLVTLSNHDNVGGIYRNAAAFGAAAVAIDPHTADPFYRKAIRVGVGAPLIVPTIRAASTRALLADLAARNVTPYALTPRGTKILGETPLAPRAAFLLGTEGDGLPDELIALAEPLAVRIAPGFDSLNVAATSALALHTHMLEHGL